MKYWLNLAADGRVLSAAECPEGDQVPDSAVIVDALPEGDLYDYRYVTSEWIDDPLPAKVVEQPIGQVALLQAQVQALTERGEFLEDCIAEMAAKVYGG